LPVTPEAGATGDGSETGYSRADLAKKLVAMAGIGKEISMRSLAAA